MDTSFVYPSAGKDDVAPKGLPGASVDPSAAAADQSDRACCCPAKAVVQVVIPPTPTRPHPTDLLLCGHHYRASRRALAAGRAVVHELPGMPRDTAAWIYHDHDRSLAPVECANLSSGSDRPVQLIGSAARYVVAVGRVLMVSAPLAAVNNRAASSGGALTAPAAPTPPAPSRPRPRPSRE
jgi:hypothetical protein